MAQINFPVATTNGQTFEAENGVIYTYVGTPPNGYWSGTFQDQSLQTLDGRYLKLDASNDPITSDLTIAKGNALLTLNSTSNNNSGQIDFNGKDASGNGYKTVTINSVNTGGLKITANPDSSSFATNPYIAFEQGSNERLRIDPDGNVGIGTVSPTAFVDLLPNVGLPTTLNSEISVVSIAAPVSPTGSTITRLQIGSRRIVEGGNTSSQSQLFLHGNRGGVAFDSGSSGSGIAAQFIYSSDNFATQSKALTVLTSGNIGIGTDSPAGLLHVAASDTARVYIEGSDGRSEIRADNGNLKFFANANSNLEGNNNIIFYRNGANESMRITSNSNVGIGTSNPDAKLEVARLGGAWTGVAPQTGTAAFFHNGNNNTNSPANLQISGGSASSSSVFFGDESDADAGSIKYGHDDDYMLFRINASERMRIDSNGNVGIGTNSPSAQLHVQNDSGTTGETFQKWTANLGTNSRSAFFLAPEVDSITSPFIFSTANSWKFRVDTKDALTIDALGNVGIGTVNPTYLLDVRGGDIVVGQDSGASTNKKNYIQFGRSANPKAAIGFINSLSNGRGSLIFMNSNDNDGASFTDASECMRIDPSGNVGIGTTSPQRILHVSNSGTENDCEIRIENTDGEARQLSFLGAGSATRAIRHTGASGGNAMAFTSGTDTHMTIDSNGNVGIGTDSPGSNLHISSDNSFTSLRLSHTDVTSFNALGRDTDGNLRINDSTNGELLRILNAGGISFEGNNAQENALDDYEEGTWTPTYIGTTTNPTVTYNIQDGRYTKIGNVVTVHGRIRTSAVTAVGGGNLRIRGLPFTSRNTTNSRGGVMLNLSSGFDATAPNRASVRPNAKDIELNVTSTNGQSNLTASALSTVTGNKNDIMFAAVYMTAS